MTGGKECDINYPMASIVFNDIPDPIYERVKELCRLRNASFRALALHVLTEYVAASYARNPVEQERFRDEMAAWKAAHPDMRRKENRGGKKREEE